MESDWEFRPRDGIWEPEIHSVDFISQPEAQKLLCHHALGNAYGSFDPDVNLDGLLQIWGGMPLFLIIAANELRRRGNTASASDEILKEIQYLGGEGRQYLPQRIVDIVYRQLRKSSQEAFLNITFFFYGWERSQVADIVGEMELGDLEGAALVTTSQQGKVMMHDIVKTRGRKLSRPRLPFRNSLCIVLRDQQVAMDEDLIDFSHRGGLLHMDEGLTHASNSIMLNIDQNILSDPKYFIVDFKKWKALRILYVMNIKESSLRVVVIYGVRGSAKTILVTALFNLDRTLFRESDYGCHNCGICIDKDSKPSHIKDMGDQMLCIFFKTKSMVYFFKAFWFIDKALKIADLRMFSLHVLEIDATTRNLLPFSLPSKILVTARHLNETDIFGHSDGIQVCSHIVDLLKPALMDERENTLLCYYASLDWKRNFELLGAKPNFHLLNNLEWLLHICEGIPCILKIACYELRRRGNTVSALREIVEEIQDLKELEGGGHLPQLMVDIVYRQLGKPSQDAFLDIAFYFYDWERRKVSDIVGEMELGDLEGAGLVTTSKEGKVKMNDIVRARGRNLSEGNRITDWESLRFVVRDPQKLEKIKGIWLPHGDFHIKTYDVHLMQSLRVLYLGCCTKLHGPWIWNFEHLRFLCISYEDILPKGQKLRKLLSKLSWLGFLVVCLTEQRLESNQAISINLPESLQLRCLEVYVPESLPLRYDSDFLPSLRIKGRFSSLGESLGSFSCLKILELNDCSELKRLPENIGNLSSLKILELNYCSDLERLSENFGNLSSLLVLNIRNCSKLERLPENIGNLSSLQRLDMSNCSKMEILPEKLGNLSSLLHLDMSNCSKLERLPENIGNLSSLLHLDMSNCSKLETLPENIGNLSSLRHLNMSHCTMLFTFPHSFADIVVRRKCALFLPPHFLPSNA